MGQWKVTLCGRKVAVPNPLGIPATPDSNKLIMGQTLYTQGYRSGIELSQAALLEVQFN